MATLAPPTPPSSSSSSSSRMLSPSDMRSRILSPQPSSSSMLLPHRRDSVGSISSSITATSSFSTRRTSANPTENVRVVVRCRPTTHQEFINKAESCWTVTQDSISLSETGSRRRREDNKTTRQLPYYFDAVFHGSDNQGLYEGSVRQLVGEAMDGYNATVFAYGQTASGKTYTMMGTESQPGVIPRAVDDVFEYIRLAITKEFVLRVSYLEIYNETIRDLLAPENDHLKIHEDRRKGIYVSPLTETVVTSPEDVMRIIRKGEANRHISTTDYNQHSSRSHTIFQMIIESRERSNPSTTIQRTRVRRPEGMKISQLNLIDLAGSEKAVSDQQRRKEGAYINKSLLTLGTVISKLTERKKGTTNSHIPFRDSKLTRVLQPSLSGEAKVVVICTISPIPQSLEESINTLKFASRVKKIVVKATNDEVFDSDKAMLQKYKSEIEELKHKLQTASEVLVQEKEHTQSMLTAERQQHEQQMRQMHLVRTALKERIDHLTRLILTSSSVPEREAQTMPNGKGDQVADGSQNNPWNLVNELKLQLKEKEQRIQTLENDNKILTDRVAHLEAELSITKAELQVTTIIAKETGWTPERESPGAPWDRK